MRRKLDVNERKGIVGASSVGAIIGVSKFPTEYEVYQDFVGIAREHSTETLEVFEMGHQLEDFIASQAERIYGYKLRKSNFAYYRPETPKIICHPDRLTSINGENWGVEIKSSSAFDDSWGTPETDEVPYGYLVQCLMYLYNIPTLKGVVLFRFSNNRLTRYVVKRTEQIEAMISSIVARVVEWIDKVENQGYVPACANDNEVKTKYPLATDSMVIADEEINESLNEYREKHKEYKELENELKLLKVRITDYMGENGTIVDSNNTFVQATFKNISKVSFDANTFKAENPEMYQKYLKSNTYRTFLIKKGA